MRPSTTIPLIAVFSHSIFTQLSVSLVAVWTIGQPAIAQQTHRGTQGPSVVACGAETSVPWTMDDGLQVLEKSIAAMDPDKHYKSAFALTGSLTDPNGVQRGTFQITENHSVLDGDFTRTISAGGLTRVVSRKDGNVSTSSMDEQLQRIKAPPRFYELPISRLIDIVRAQNAVVHVVKPSGTESTKEDFPGTIHVEI